MWVLTGFFTLLKKVLHSLYLPFNKIIRLRVQQAWDDMGEPIAAAEFLKGTRRVLDTIVCNKLTGDIMLINNWLEVCNDCCWLGVWELLHHRKSAVIVSYQEVVSIVPVEDMRTQSMPCLQRHVLGQQGRQRTGRGAGGLQPPVGKRLVLFGQNWFTVRAKTQ